MAVWRACASVKTAAGETERQAGQIDVAERESSDAECTQRSTPRPPGFRAAAFRVVPPLLAAYDLWRSWRRIVHTNRFPSADARKAGKPGYKKKEKKCAAIGIMWSRKAACEYGV